MEKALIYIIDDEMIPIKVLEMILKEGNYEVRSFQRVMDGFDAILEKAPDLVILDFNMPGMNGFELMDQLIMRKIKTRIMICSGANEDSMVKKALIHGACECINKVAINMGILEIIQSILSSDNNFLPMSE